MENNKFTKEQFLLLAECEYAFCDNVKKSGDMLSGKAEDFKGEVIRLAEKAEEIMPNAVMGGRKILKVGAHARHDAAEKAKAIFIFENKVCGGKKGGLYAIICLYDELKGEKDNE